MSGNLKYLQASFAICAALMLSGCNEDKAANKGEPASKSGSAEAGNSKSGDLAAKVEAAKEAVKDVAHTAAAKVEAAAEHAKEAAKDAAKEAVDAAAVKVDEAKVAVKEAVEAAKPAEPKPAPVATAEAPAAPAAAPAPAAEAPKAEAAPAAAPAPAAAANDGPPVSPENAEVQAQAKADGVTFKDARYRNADDQPVPVVTKDYKVDWAVWQGFRRYHDACHVCHGPNALGSTFAPSLSDSLKTMDYETFFGIVVGGKRENRGGTEFVMPAFGEDKNIMCYLDDIYSYIKARSINVASDGKAGLPPGRPNGREDISPEARKRAADCEG